MKMQQSQLSRVQGYPSRSDFEYEESFSGLQESTAKALSAQHRRGGLCPFLFGKRVCTLVYSCIDTSHTRPPYFLHHVLAPATVTTLRRALYFTRFSRGPL